MPKFSIISSFEIREHVTPSTIAGYGGSQGRGAGIAVRSTWYSFANYDDLKNFKTAIATISGEQNAWSFSISWKKLKGFSANSMYSITGGSASNKKIEAFDD